MHVDSSRDLYEWPQVALTGPGSAVLPVEEIYLTLLCSGAGLSPLQI